MRILCFFVLCFGFPASWAQTFIPDPGFQGYLQEKYPGIFDEANNTLDNSLAEQVDTMIIESPEVQDLEGLSGFRNLTHLTVRNSQIESLAELPGLTLLQSIELDNNTGLSEIPNLSSLATLSSFICRRSNLTSTDMLSGLAPLEMCDLSFNEIVALSPNFPQTTQLFLNWNKLTSLDNLPIPNVLKDMVVSNNELALLPDFSTGFPALERLDLSGNMIVEIPNYSEWIGQLNYLQLNNNTLSIDSIMAMLPFLPGGIMSPNFLIDQQQDDYLNANYAFELGKPGVLKLPVTVESSSLSYTWKRSGASPIDFGGFPDTFFIPSANLSDIGTFEVEAIYTNGINNYTLKRFQGIFVSVFSCPEPVIISGTFLPNTCSDTLQLHIEIPETVEGAQLPLGLVVSNGSSQMEFENDGYLPSGTYGVQLTDDNGCVLDSLGGLSFEPDFSGCLELAEVDNKFISPQEPGKEQLYISQQGEVRIYNADGIYVKSLTGPTFWNGTNASGQIVTEQYFIFSGGRWIAVAVIN